MTISSLSSLKLSRVLWPALCTFLILCSLDELVAIGGWRTSSCRAPLLPLLSRPLNNGDAAAVEEGNALPAAGGSPIPQKIWQMFFTRLRFPSIQHHVHDWLRQAPDYTYTLLGSQTADEFVRKHYGDGERGAGRRDIVEAYRAVQNPALKSDLLRYLVLLVEGGVYSDVDTTPVAELGGWVTAERQSDVRLVVAVDHDELFNSGDEYGYPVQFSQWTIAAAPGHPVVADMVERAMAGLQDLVAAHNVTLDQLVRLPNYDAVNATGSIAWTEAVMRGIGAVDPQMTHPSNLSGLNEIRYFGDIMVLPIEGFMANMQRAGSGEDHFGLVTHDFQGAWKGGVIDS
ncbi:hypothetical protein DL766_003787 [Monosporascus sp. MC13-8B]|uniref:Initiation-specific alpha-1,6-mannosyltransferase n=1 Tax=Monosporascus cannonballus TaxID=155416 RepID=A0ABY0HF36_9PEZI|nr:hypothetical protein DL763_010805 [Monosporascus cannonballus]RYO90264.1 hypothetical protein DL762_002786 [Monosporascus cannonballus]RYP32814.1 hypothetical protein DL766_003787 [Monosporascus sp. MC13-8B]